MIVHLCLICIFNEQDNKIKKNLRFWKHISLKSANSSMMMWQKRIRKRKLHLRLHLLCWKSSYSNLFPKYNDTNFTSHEIYYPYAWNTTPRLELRHIDVWIKCWVFYVYFAYLFQAHLHFEDTKNRKD